MTDPIPDSTPDATPDRTSEPASQPRTRSTFGPVVLLGLTSAGLAAIASAKPWVDTGSSGGGSDATMTALDAGTRYPLASAVSLVLLASWGVLLVTRGTVRRVFAALALLSAVGLVATVVAGYVTLPDTALDSYQQLRGRTAEDTGFTGWFWTAAVASVVSLMPAVLAVRLCPTWPEMGRRYDAPGSSAATAPEAAIETDLDLWHALDEGRDPTDQTRP